MFVKQQITFENDAYSVTLSIPTLANCQAITDYCRPLLINAVKRAGESENSEALLDMAFCPFDELKARYDVLKPFIIELKDGDGELVDLENVPMPALNFLALVLPTFYRNVFEQSEIKKK